MNPLKKIEPDIQAVRNDSVITTYETAHGPMRVASVGNSRNPPVIFVHGSPGSWEVWAAYLRNENLRGRYHLLAIDRPGYGGSRKGHVEPSMQVQAADALAVLQLNKSGKPAIVIGHSLGGAVIARMAMDEPGKVSGLIFLASSVDPQQENYAWYQHMLHWPVFSWMLPSQWYVCNEELRPFKGELEKMLPLWPNITARAIVLQGSKDTLVPEANLDFIVGHLKPEQIVRATRLPGVNHFFLWDTPEVVLQAFTDMENAE
jgi:pimeloyl-ACP methyl ester carboxylesterase